MSKTIRNAALVRILDVISEIDFNGLKVYLREDRIRKEEEYENLSFLNPASIKEKIDLRRDLNEIKEKISIITKAELHLKKFYTENGSIRNYQRLSKNIGKYN